MKCHQENHAGDLEVLPHAVGEGEEAAETIVEDLGNYLFYLSSNMLVSYKGREFKSKFDLNMVFFNCIWSSKGLETSSVNLQILVNIGHLMARPFPPQRQRPFFLPCEFHDRIQNIMQLCVSREILWLWHIICTFLFFSVKLTSNYSLKI